MNELYDFIVENRTGFVKATFSSPAKGGEFARTVLRAVKVKNAAWQAERFAGTKVFHLNLTDEGLSAWLVGEGAVYGQICVQLEGRTVSFLARKSGYKRVEQKNTLRASAPTGNNREKEYLLKEGEEIPALVDLGVFTPAFRVKSDKYDKYKQINRFVEIVDDELGKSKKEQFTVVDFGCGKSYLTFILYYYLVIKTGRRARIIGYDLKEDVVARCNQIAQKYGYDGLEFYVNDVTKGKLYEGEVDMVVTLHACDVATDYALAFAVEKGARYIFSVPCCQHEVNGSIQKGGEFDLLLEDGLLKERFSALLTDSIRAELLRQKGYAVDVLEFVDFSHSPKNIMLRAHRTGKQVKEDFSRVQELMIKYAFSQRLYDLLKK